MSKNKESYAKGMGLKSALVSGSKVYMTGFEGGSGAKLEKVVENDEIASLSKEETFSAEIFKKNIGCKIENKQFRHPKGYDVIADNPIYKGSPRQDMLGLKETLEKRYFSPSDSIDNVRVQVIHNILDIEKILAEYITNAVYSFDNIAGFGEDIIGMGGFKPIYTYEQFKEPDKYNEKFDDILNNSRLGYYGKAFFETNDLKHNPNKEQRDKNPCILKYDNECYYIIALLSGLRHWNVHSHTEDDLISYRWLYNLDSKLSKEYISTLNYLYDDIADELTESFSKNSAANVNYIAETLNIDPTEFAQQYFRFSIMKEQKNMGFNVSKLREIMLDRKALSDIRDNHREFDSIRSKLYTMMDFVIYRYYIEEAAKTEAENRNLPENEKKISEKDFFVINLRGSFNENQKEKLYIEEAERLWKKLKDTMLKIKEFRGKKVEEYKKAVPRIKRILPKGKNISTFSKLMYMLSMFLDGKEINDLFTTLINKFDNIQCFLKIMPLIGVNAKFTEDYAFFNNSEKIADELRLIKSFARMGEPVANTKRVMMIDAIKILGTDLSDDELKEMADSFFKDSDGNLLKKGKHGMRNFITNNVIKNKRFHYLIRYGDPAHLHEIAKNEAVVRFVLGRIADIQKKQGKNGKNQIDRYYETCVGNGRGKTVSQKLDELTKIIVNMNYDQFEQKKEIIENTRTKTKDMSYDEKQKLRKDNAEREKFKKIISLYLTVIYEIIKHIVNINSRYVIGFHCLERDAQLYSEKYNNKGIAKKISEGKYSSLTKFCLGESDEKKLKALAKKSFEELETTNPKLYKNYINYSDERKAEEAKRQINRERAKTAMNAHLRNTKWNDIMYGQLKDLEDSKSRICSDFRNNAAHLEAARYAHLYINDISEINSYFQLYHYIMQRRIIDKINGKCEGKVKTYFNDVMKNGEYSKNLLKLMCVPFGYCITRFKNLSIEQMFDMNETDNSDKKKEK